MTNLVGFAEKRNSFWNETIENGTISGTKRLKNDAKQHRAKRPHKAKTSVSKTKTLQICHCEERSDVAIFKPKVWHPVAKHGSGKRQNAQVLIRPAGAPPRCFSGSAISRGRQPAFPVLQHLSHDQRSYFTAQPHSAKG